MSRREIYVCDCCGKVKREDIFGIERDKISLDLEVDDMNKLVTKIKFGMPCSHKIEIYMYGEASVEANQEMQEPLEKLYQYENQPDMRKKIKEYVGELDTEIDKLEDLLKNTDSPYDLQIKGRLNAIIEVKNDLLGRLKEKC